MCGGSTPAGYNWAGLGENIYAYGRDLYYTHASFEVDWGGSDYGMQKPAGHRLNNHSKDHREIGVGLRLGYSGYGAADVGPVVGTVDFGSQRSSPAFVTGVAYYDLNGNQRYDVNEGHRRAAGGRGGGRASCGDGVGRRVCGAGAGGGGDAGGHVFRVCGRAARRRR